MKHLLRTGDAPKMKNTVTIERILKHRIDENGRTSVLIKFSKPLALQSWLPLNNKKYELPWLEYSACLLRTASNVNMKARAREVYQILSKCLYPDELTVLSKKYLTNRGLQLPPSNKEEIMNYIGRLLKSCSRSSFSVPSVHKMRDLRQKILLQKLIKARRKLVNENRVHEWIINTLSSNRQYVSFVNNVDLERFPQSLIWIEDYKLGLNVNISKDEQVAIGCKCSGNACDMAKCQHGDEKCAYNADGRIMWPEGKPIYECNPFCGCAESCANRVCQKGANFRMEIFRCHKGNGFAVRSAEKIPKGSFIALYAGEVIPWNEAETRLSSEYLFDLDFNYQADNGPCPFTVDAAQYGNVSRFFNHSCKTNLSVFAIYTKIIYPEFCLIGFFTSKDIKAGEELCFNYMHLIEQKIRKCRCKDHMRW